MEMFIKLTSLIFMNCLKINFNELDLIENQRSYLSTIEKFLYSLTE